MVRTCLLLLRQSLLSFLVEKELLQGDLEVQLAFRDFVIFPQRDTIVIIKKIRVRFPLRSIVAPFTFCQSSLSKKFTHKSLSLIINLDKCTVNIWGGEAVPADFNKVLLGAPSPDLH